MENSKQKLEMLIKRNEELKPVIFKSFETMKELKRYKEKNKNIFDEYFDNQEQVEKLEYELMSSKEKEEHDEYLRLLKLKAEGKFPL